MPAMNGEHLLRVEAAVGVMNNDIDIFSIITSAMPLAINGEEEFLEDMGCQAPSGDDEFDAAFKLGIYRCAGNVAWINFAWRPDPGVPISLGRVNDVKDYFSPSQP